MHVVFASIIAFSIFNKLIILYFRKLAMWTDGYNSQLINHKVILKNYLNSGKIFSIFNIFNVQQASESYQKTHFTTI